MKPRGALFFPLLIVVFALVLEIFLLQHHFPIVLLIIFRCALGFTLFSLLPEGIRPQLFSRPVLIWVLIFWIFLGVLALPAFFFFLLFSFKRKKQDSRIEEYQQYLFDDTYLQDEFQELLTSIFEEEDEDREEIVQPLMDILLGTNLSWKLSMVVQLSKYHNPGSVRLLKKARADSNPEVRMMAAISLTKIETHFTSCIQEAEIVLAESDSKNRRENLMKLVGSLDKSLFIGLWDMEVRKEFIRKAVKIYRQLTKREPENTEIRYLFCRFLLRNNMLDEAIEYLDKSLSLEPENPRLLLWKMEAYYRQGKYDEIVSLSEKLSVDDIEEPKMKAVVMWWKNA